MPLIAGTVVDKRGAPVSAAAIFLAEGPVAVPDIAMLTGADGSFAINAPVPGIYCLGVRSGDEVTEIEIKVAAAGEPDLRVQV